MNDFDVSQFIWTDFDKYHTNIEEPGMERFMSDRFKREYMTFRATQMPGKIVTLGPKVELPTGSILHLMDDWWFDTHQDTPRIENNTFILRESLKRFIYHVKEPELNGPLQIDDKFIYKQAGLPTALMEFRSKYGSKFKYCNGINEIPNKKDTFIVVNHNPINRLTVFGKLKFFRKFQLMLTHILNVMHQLKDFDKHQWLHIPWTEQVFDRMSFFKSRENLDISALKEPENFYWLMAMHLHNYVFEGAKTSIFDQVDKRVAAQINLILSLNDKYVFYNLKDLKDLNDKNKAYIKFTNQLDLLSVMGRVSSAGANDGVPTELQDEIEAVQNKEEVAISDTSVVTETVTTSYDTKQKDESVKDKIIKKLDTLIPKAKPSSVVKGGYPINYQIPDVHESQLAEQDLKKSSKEGDKKADKILKEARQELEQYNATRIYLNEELQSDAKICEEYYKEINEATAEYINNREELTPKQKERYMKLSKKWEEVKLGSVPMKQLVVNSNDLSLEHQEIPKDLVGDLPTEDALRSSITALDKDYMDKTFPKHVAAILTSFSKNGVFLIDLKEEKEITELTRVIHYTAFYEDIHGKKSNIKFTIPIVDRDGRLTVDGQTKVLKKQKVNLPIVKISDTVVSLASNQNKTRVERNVNKAHSYSAYVEGLLNHKGCTAKVIYGKSHPNLPLGYEYSIIGERYKQITFNEDGTFDLYFDYATRLDHFKDKYEKMMKLEAQYGTYCGMHKHNWLFVDNANTVTEVKSTGGEEAEYESISRILLKSIREGESYDKVLTEWCNVKILDAYLPVIYLLAYRFGLRKVLDFLKVKYTVTEKRSKVIVGEGGVAGYEELFGANVNNIPADHGEDFQGTDWIKIAGQEAAKADLKTNHKTDSIPMEDAPKISKLVPKPPKLSTSKINGLKYIKKLGISNTKLIVGASAGLILWGIQDKPNRDLDCHIEPHELKKLYEQGKIDLITEDSGLHTVLKDTDDFEIDFGIVDEKGRPMMPWKGPEEGTVVVDGIRFDNIYAILKFYGFLKDKADARSYGDKSDFFIDKRNRQMKMITDKVSEWFDHQCYHATPTGGITEMRASIAPSYKKRGPLVFASYFKHFAMIFGFKWNDEIIHNSWTILEDGITPHCTIEIRKELKESILKSPFSLYTMSDKNFQHLLWSDEDGGNGHPIVEVIHRGNVKVMKEQKFKSWWDCMLSFEEQGLVTIKNKNRVIKDKILKGFDKAKDLGVEVEDVDLLPDDRPLPPNEGDIDAMTAEEAKSVIMPPISADIRYAPRYGDIQIKFADRVIWINRYPLVHSLIVAGLDMFDCTPYTLAQFESKDVYYKLLQDKNMSINYLKGVDHFFDTFIDPITYNTLQMMKEPTTVKELLIRAVVLLSTTDARAPSSSKNFRVRGYEQFAAILYNEMARQYGTYSNMKGKAASFSIPPEAVYLRILQNQSMITAETANPLESVKEKTYLTHTGIGGRSAESFVTRDRRVTRDDTGIMAESTVDNQKVGINAYLTVDPGIVNTMGVLDPKPISEQSPAESFSIFANTMPYATLEDSKRLNLGLQIGISVEEPL